MGQTAKLVQEMKMNDARVQEMKMNDARVAPVFFFSNFIKLLCAEAGHWRPKRDVSF